MTPLETRDDPPHLPRASLAAAGALLVLHGLLVWLVRPAGIETGGDDARYLLLADALRDLHYVELWRAGTPIHSLYPPGFPGLLALWNLVAGRAFDSQIVLGIVCSVAALSCVFALAARHLDHRIALAGLAVAALNPNWIARSSTVASEMPYAMWSALALWFVFTSARTHRYAALAGACVILAALTRSAGVTLMAAVVLELYLRGQRRAAILVALATVVTVGPWLVWTARAPDQVVGASYVADALGGRGEDVSARQVLGEIASRIAAKPQRFARALASVVIPMPTVVGTPVDNAVGLAVAAVGIVAGLVAAWRPWRPAVLYVLAYGGLLLVWQWQVRFLEPIQSLLAVVWVLGLWSLLRRLRPRFRVSIMALALTATLVASAAWTVGAVSTRWRCGRDPAPPGPNACLRVEEYGFMAAVRWLRDSTAANVRVLTVKPGNFYYFARRQTVFFPAAIARGPSQFSQALRDQRVDYVVLTALTDSERDRLARHAEAACHELRVAARLAPDAWILSPRLEPGSGMGDDACAAVAEYRRAVGRERLPRARTPGSGRT